MKLLSFRLNGRDTFGAVVDRGVVDLGARLKLPSLRAALAQGANLKAGGTTADAALDQITFLPVIPDPAKIFGIGLNYEAHRIETGRDKFKHPVVFTRWADSQVGHKQPLVKPAVSDKFDYEGELGVIIGPGKGTGGRRIGEAQAMNHVAGFACYFDGSVRDWQGHSPQFTPGKNFPATGGFGPWMVTPDEAPAPDAMTLVTRLNGAEVQKSGVDDLIFKVPALIAYISQFTTLSPGDVIATGTPGGVGYVRKPPLYMKGGDAIEVEITGLGVLQHPVIAEGAA